MTTSEQPLPNGDIDELLHRSQQMARDLITSDGRRRSGVETLVGAVEVMNTRYKDLAERMAEVQAELRTERALTLSLREEIGAAEARYQALATQNATVVREFDAFIAEIGKRTQQTLEDDRVIEAAVAMSEATIRFGDDTEVPRSFAASPRVADREPRRPARRDFDEDLDAPAAIPERVAADISPMPSFLRSAATTDESQAGEDMADAAEQDELAPELAEERGAISALRAGFGQLARITSRGNS